MSLNPTATFSNPARRQDVSKGAWLTACLAAALVLVLGTLAALAQDLPALSGRVVDNAGLIDAAAERALVAKLAAFEDKSSDQIVVATIVDLGGAAIEPYANRLFRAWGLGQAGEDNGILLLIARDDRKMRIEVGYGLEGSLTDLHAKLIIENTMVPAFRAGDYAGGITGAVDDIILVLEGNAAELEARAERNEPQDGGMPWFVIAYLAIWAVLFFGSFAFAFLAPVFGRKLGPGRYEWMGVEMDFNGSGRSGGSGRTRSGRSSWSSAGGGGGGFSGGGGSSGGGGASGSW